MSKYRGCVSEGQGIVYISTNAIFDEITSLKKFQKQNGQKIFEKQMGL